MIYCELYIVMTRKIPWLIIPTNIFGKPLIPLRAKGGLSLRLALGPIFGVRCGAGNMVKKVAAFASCQLHEIRKPMLVTFGVS